MARQTALDQLPLLGAPGLAGDDRADHARAHRDGRAREPLPPRHHRRRAGGPVAGEPPGDRPSDP